MECTAPHQQQIISYGWIVLWGTKFGTKEDHWDASRQRTTARREQVLYLWPCELRQKRYHDSWLGTTWIAKQRHLWPWTSQKDLTVLSFIRTSFLLVFHCWPGRKCSTFPSTCVRVFCLCLFGVPHHSALLTVNADKNQIHAKKCLVVSCLAQQRAEWSEVGNGNSSHKRRASSLSSIPLTLLSLLYSRRVLCCSKQGVVPASRPRLHHVINTGVLRWANFVKLGGGFCSVHHNDKYDGQDDSHRPHCFARSRLKAESVMFLETENRIRHDSISGKTSLKSSSWDISYKNCNAVVKFSFISFTQRCEHHMPNSIEDAKRPVRQWMVW